MFPDKHTYGWLVKVEVEENNRTEMVLVTMEGTTLAWFQLLEDQVPYSTRREFRKALIKRFQPSVARDPLDPLLKVKQTASVMEDKRSLSWFLGKN